MSDRDQLAAKVDALQRQASLLVRQVNQQQAMIDLLQRSANRPPTDSSPPGIIRR